ncbi:MAG TPA: hypothetical protein VH374_12275 [Polyangia bacterium]|nr:hypothetical protein [Polyangia bacterium]
MKPASRVRWLNLLGLGAALTIVGCAFDPQLPNARYQCTPNSTQCPDGFLCVQVPGLRLEDGNPLSVCCQAGNCQSGLDQNGKPKEPVIGRDMIAPFDFDANPTTPADGGSGGNAPNDAAINSPEASASGGSDGAGGSGGNGAGTGGAPGGSPDANMIGNDASVADHPIDTITDTAAPDLPEPPRCGNGVVDPGETCDPAASCPTTCPWTVCQRRRLSGSPGLCTAVCVDDGVQGQCANNDGCCPSGCNANNDSDCKPTCGNGVIEQGEVCDGNCPTSCAPLGCTKQRLQGSGCAAKCVSDGLQTVCQDNDDCCPGTANNCNATNDKECAAVCGNGVIESGEHCDPVTSCQTQLAACVSDKMTVKTRQGSASDCTFQCTSTARTCVSGDGYCPDGCRRPQDDDCPKEPGEMCSAGSDCRLGFCHDAVCCDSACTGSCQSCDLPGHVGTCSPFDFSADNSNCGSCGTVCSNNHVTPSCAGGVCGGACQTGWTDCNKNKQTDGCEINTAASATDCGTCGTVCPYGVCQNGNCAATKWGFPNPNTTSENRGANAVMGMKVTIGTAGRIAALGLRTVTGAVHVRLAVYTDNLGAPNALVIQTGELLSVANGATEGTVPLTSVAAGDYWFFFVSDAVLRVNTEAPTTAWWFATQTYGTLPATAPPLMTVTQAFADLYVVTVP